MTAARADVKLSADAPDCETRRAPAQKRPGMLDRIATTAYGPRQTAVVRIALALIWLALLIRELPNRHDIWGPDAPWGYDQASRAMDSTGGFSFFGWHDGTLWFELCYAASFVVACCMLVGWRTRTAAILFALFMMSFQHRNEYVLNAGENILRITAIYLVFTRCADVWSIDARNHLRRARSSDHTGTALWAMLGLLLAYVTYLGYPSVTWTILLWSALLLYGVLWQLRRSGGPHLRTLHELISNMVHNAAVVLIVIQICLLYAAAGWYKIQGSLWQDGTAVHWSMNIDFLNSWPFLTDLLTGHSWIVLLLTYATVMVQVAFPFSLLNRRAKNVLLAVLIVEHLGIALLMGLVFFSLAMIAVDLIFLPTSLLVRVERYAGAWWQRIWHGPSAEGQPRPDSAAVPGPVRHAVEQPAETRESTPVAASSAADRPDEVRQEERGRSYSTLPTQRSTDARDAPADRTSAPQNADRRAPETGSLEEPSEAPDRPSPGKPGTGDRS